VTTPAPEEQHDSETFVRITNAMVYAELQATRADLRDLAQRVGDYPDLKKRTRALELKFYGVVAGIIAALGVVVAGGLPR
jgi:hypothetical protein